MADFDRKTGVLFVVATPIGNLEDFSPRAQRILREVDLIAAEDTRHSAGLLHRFGIETPRIALHEHNERDAAPGLVRRMEAGESIGLISDAGTPLVSDPGYRLVRAAVAAGIEVRPVSGPSAAITALSAAGLATDRFVFEGFLPAKTLARRRVLERLKGETRTVVLYESPRRVYSTLSDALAILGEVRSWVIARELTKLHEQWARGTARELLEWLDANADRRRGEFVLLLVGAPVEPVGERLEIEQDELLAGLLEELPLKGAVSLAARLSDRSRNQLYTRALELKDRDRTDGNNR